VIGEAVEAYLATLPQRREPELDEAWFADFDETAHVAYEPCTPPTRLARLGAWLVRRKR